MFSGSFGGRITGKHGIGGIVMLIVDQFWTFPSMLDGYTSREDIAYSIT